MQRHLPTSAGAYLTGPILPNPAALFSYGVAPVAAPTKPVSFPGLNTEKPEISDSDVSEAIERLTKAPSNTPEALQQAALDMELVISHFDSLSEAFGPEAALTSLALDLASNGRSEQPARPKARRVVRRRRVAQPA